MVVIPCRSRYQAFIFEFISAHFGYGDQSFNIIDDPHEFDGSVAEKYFCGPRPPFPSSKNAPTRSTFHWWRGWEGGVPKILLLEITCSDIRLILDLFIQDLQPQVKLKLLLSFFHISRRNLELWRAQLETILEVALRDSEPWVSMLAELMKTFPATGI